jgi:hypothetical protein
MRLLHYGTLKSPHYLEFETFDDDSAPPYAILSHTWGRPADEVSFQEMRDRTGTSKAGYEKIRRCGEIAAKEGLDYFWVDTCCIDKTSSEELSQAINSMFIWYKRAAVCYAYLSDISSTSAAHPLYPTLSSFGTSMWFSRGWTLQELITPANVNFFSREWGLIGTKETLKAHISEITGIQSGALQGVDMRTFSVSDRMSWASKRKTTRPEDIAYSLMGIFDVNMPLLYGEREKSFIRLQEEIMKNCDDHSLFAWTDRSVSPEVHRGLLASSPKQFPQSANISSLGIWGKGSDFSVTNKGLRIQLFLIPYLEEQGIFRASLDCSLRDSFDLTPGIYLKRISGSEETWASSSETQFARIHCGQLDELKAAEKARGQYRTVFVRQDQAAGHQDFLQDAKLFRIICNYDGPCNVYPARQWNPQTELFVSDVAVGKAGGAFFNHIDSGLRYMVIFGISEGGLPWAHLLTDVSSNPYRDWTSYQFTGDELPKFSYISTPCINAVIAAVEIHRRPVFLLRVTVNYIKYVL